MKRVIGLLGLAAVLGGIAWQRSAAPERVGPLAGGGFRLSSGWKIRAAGKQIPLETLPLAARTFGDNKLLVLQAGWRKPTLSLHALPAGEELARIAVDDAFLGLAVAGERVLVGGGVTDRVHELQITGRQLQLVRSWPRLGTGRGFLGDVAISAGGREAFAANMAANAVEVFSFPEGRWQRSFPTGRIPYRLLFHGADLLVTSWTDGEVWRHNPADGAVRQRLPVGPHTTDLLAVGGRIFVAAANTNAVFALAVDGGGELRVQEQLNVSLMPRQPVGMTPSALGASDDGKRLYVVCSDANAMAVADISTPGRSRILGFLPTGWYPTEVTLAPGGLLTVLNGKGLRSWPNPGGPQDNRKERSRTEYVGNLQTGTLALIDPFDEAQLQRYTRTVFENSPYRDQLLDRAETPQGNPVPARVGDPSPIRHVIYVVKENRTYDQVFGDLPEGNGDPSLVLFGEESSPNHRKLAREFVLFDNFYVNGDVSADGHNWSAAAIAPDITQKLWPNSYGGRSKQFSLYWGRPPADSTQDAARPAGGYLWTRAFEAGLRVRNYGWYTRLLPKPDADGAHADAAESAELWKATNPRFRGFDVSYPDVERMQVFLEDLAASEKSGEFPHLTLMRLGNDHTAGMKAGALSPRALFADNDLALGQLVEAVSRSRFWKQTAIFVVEDDAQSGPDHVDSHRSLAFVASPYAKRRVVDSTMYNTASVLRTMELILGLPPMTHFDAGARPMASAFVARPDFRPYQAVMPKASRMERNPEGGPLAARSARLDFREADEIDDHELNDILWRGIKGEPPPAPMRSWFNPTLGRGSSGD